MAWTTLPTYVSGNALTAAQMNAIADNIEESAAAKATTAGQYFAASAANTLVARTPTADLVSNTDTRTSTSYGDLANTGPTVVMTVSAIAIVNISALSFNSASSAGTYMDIDISGASTVTPNDERGIVWQGTLNNGERWSASTLFALTAGSNTMRAKYRVDSNTGTWKWRRMWVLGF